MSEKKLSCPLCRKETLWKDNPFRPFCSERCRLTDLGKWASEEYRISGERRGTSESTQDAQEADSE